MKLWLISQSVNNGYDTYDSAIVAAPDDMAASLIHPNGYGEPEHGQSIWPCWAPIDKVAVELIGEGDHEAGTVLCSSFNAG